MIFLCKEFKLSFIAECQEENIVGGMMHFIATRAFLMKISTCSLYYTGDLEISISFSLRCDNVTTRDFGLKDFRQLRKNPIPAMLSFLHSWDNFHSSQSTDTSMEDENMSYFHHTYKVWAFGDSPL